MRSICYCVITYNRPQFALELAQSFAAYQSTGAGSNVEMLVINNGSELPPTEASAWPSSVKLVRAPTNLGVAGGRNFGARCSSADLVVFLDDDLRLDFAALTEQIRIDTQHFAQWTAITYQVVRTDGTFHRSEVPHRQGIESLAHGCEVAYVLGGCLAVTRTGFLAVGGFSSELGQYGMEEIEFSCRMLLMGGKLYYSRRVQVVHLKEASGRLPSQEERTAIAVNRCRLARTYLPAVLQLTHVGIWALWLVAHTRDAKAFSSFVIQAWRPLEKAPKVTSVARLTLARTIRRLGGRVLR